MKKSIEKALALHKHFVSNKTKFYKEAMIQYFQRLPINFVGLNCKQAKDAFQVVKHVYVHELYPKTPAKDEFALTTFANAVMLAKEVIYMRLVVAHGTFVSQWSQSKNVTSKITQLYKKEGLS